MLIRISLILAILLGLATGGWDYFKVKEELTKLQDDRLLQRSEKEKAQADARDTHAKLERTNAALVMVRGELATTRNQLTQANAQIGTLNGTITRLNREVLTATEARNAAQRELAAYEGTNMKPEDIIAMKSGFKVLQDEIAARSLETKLLAGRNEQLQDALDRIRGRKEVIYLPADLHGKVEVTDPKYGFVILNVGLAQGVKKDGELLVHRNGRLVAKVYVSRIDKQSCVANLSPGPWKLTDIFEGDLVVPANPET